MAGHDPAMTPDSCGRCGQTARGGGSGRLSSMGNAPSQAFPSGRKAEEGFDLSAEHGEPRGGRRAARSQHLPDALQGRCGAGSVRRLATARAAPGVGSAGGSGPRTPRASGATPQGSGAADFGRRRGARRRTCTYLATRPSRLRLRSPVRSLSRRRRSRTWSAWRRGRGSRGPRCGGRARPRRNARSVRSTPRRSRR